MNGSHARDHGQCLTDETLADYLDSGLDPLVRAACDEHLVGCDDCRKNLAHLIRLLRPDEDPREQAEIQAIAEIYERQNRLAIPPRKAGLGRWLFPAAAAILCVVGLLYFRFGPEPMTTLASQEEVVRALMDAAVSRPFEAMLTRQPYKPISPTRGAQDSGLDDGLVDQIMADRPEDAYQMGRMYLFRKEFQLAIDWLEQAARQSPKSPAILNDLGVAYLGDGNKEHEQKAFEKFNMALEADPRFVPTVFNLAVYYYNKAKDTSRAKEYWRLYLELDPDSDWAMEVRSHLEGASR